MPTTRLVSSVLAAVALACAAHPLAAQPEAHNTPPAEDLQHVIPPGQEPLLADLLGSGQALPGGCKFADGQIDRSAIVATYDCGGGQVVFEVRHPDEAPSSAVRSERFALAIRSGTPPQGLTDAILARVRAREKEFEWKHIGAPGGSGLARVLPIAGAALLALALLVWLVRRGRATRPAAGG
jgi:hypothetical protein